MWPAHSPGYEDFTEGERGSEVENWLAAILVARPFMREGALPRRFSKSASFLLALGMTALWGCVGTESPGCAYSAGGGGTGTIRITSVDPNTTPARSDKGQPCSAYSYVWLTGGPPAYPDADVIYASDACAFGAGIVIGAVFQASFVEGLSAGEPEGCPLSLREYEDPEILGCSTNCRY
jgi:hypothetical protein